MKRKDHTSGTYTMVHCPGHPGANRNGFVHKHRLVAEKALGRFLPPGVEVHHVDERGNNNANSNLVICQDSEYHKLLHTRMRALAICGNPNWRKCRYCEKYDDPANLLNYAKNYYNHRSCIKAYRLTHRRVP